MPALSISTGSPANSLLTPARGKRQGILALKLLILPQNPWFCSLARTSCPQKLRKSRRPQGFFFLQVFHQNINQVQFSPLPPDLRHLILQITQTLSQLDRGSCLQSEGEEHLTFAALSWPPAHPHQQALSFQECPKPHSKPPGWIQHYPQHFSSLKSCF